MIVRERELVVVTSTGRQVWPGDMVIDPEKPPFRGESTWFKVKHQLTCSDCRAGVREQDDHHCSDPD